MPRLPDLPTSLVLMILRAARGWTQKDLAQAASASNNVLSGYETGFRSLSLRRLEELAAVMGFGPPVVDVALQSAQTLLTTIAPPPPDPSLMGPDEEEWRCIQQAAMAAGREAFEQTRGMLTEAVLQARAQEFRRKAGEQWERLRRLPPKERRALVEAEPRLQSWALCERLCAESAKAAADEASRALELAQLALYVAELVPGKEAWRSRVQGYAWAFVGNAQRVGGDLSQADQTFALAWQLWRLGASSDIGLLDEARLLDLEASLRKHQGRFAEALTLLNQALTVTKDEKAVGRILLIKAVTQEQMEDAEGAIATLEEASARVDGEHEARLMCVLRFNLVVNLTHLEKYTEAAAILPEVRALAEGLGNGLDLVRVLWLDGRISAGLGQRDAAMAALQQVQGEFSSREIAYDAALVSLELAVLYLEDGQTSEVRNLARQMLWIFRAQGVHREALAALRLFCEAAEREEATVALARRVANYLEKSRNNPHLRFV
jgi:transcriptional regulator with XRE-family HTH domain